MKLSNNYFFTMKENVKDEESISANLLVRSGMVKKAGSGIYYFLPLGLKCIRKIENIVRDEMNKIGSNELVMPSLLPEDVYVASGRRDIFGHDMFSLQDRFSRRYVLGPTHEEMFVEVARDVIKSYKDMPISLYQVANKYRDEPRSRYGLIRTREFIMKDAYTFDKDEEGLDKSYQLMFSAYQRIFDRIGLDYKIVTAGTGAMGGNLSEEFQAICDIGEDTLVLCDHCGYASNIEICQCSNELCDSSEAELERERIFTPNVGTIQDLYDQYQIEPKKMVKTLIYNCDGKFYACLIRGDREVNEYKVGQLLGAKSVSIATTEEDEAITHAKVGFAGPIGLDIPIIIDKELLEMKNFLVGANETDYHFINVNLKDFSYDMIGDIRNIMQGDKCPNCGKDLQFKRGIEVGNTFKLGTKYSEALDLFYVDKTNQLRPVVMGCYGIGIARILASVVEQNHDEYGMILPEAIAPYEIAIVVVNMKDQEQVRVAMDLYEKLQALGRDVLLDDRDIRVGIKFKDIDLIGVPKRITVGKRSCDGVIEYKLRRELKFREISLDDVFSII